MSFMAAVHISTTTCTWEW